MTGHSTFDAPPVAAAALFLDASGYVPLVHPTNKGTWDLQGSYVERGESSAVACEREMAEEPGLDWLPNRLTAVDWAPHERGGDKLLFLLVCGDLGANENQFELHGYKVDPSRMVDLARRDHYVIPRIAGYIQSTATNGTDPSCLEHGESPARSGTRRRTRRVWAGPVLSCGRHYIANARA
ncbi:MAG: NUDIX hydrolase [Pseudonocardiales bacterium]|nr:NUDIX hydrolase [Pseudonocardiales bacterium]